MHTSYSASVAVPSVPRGIDASVARTAAAQLRALTKPDRLRVLSHLGKGEKTASEIAQGTGLRAHKAMEHLLVLCQHGYVQCREDAGSLRFSWVDDGVATLIDSVVAVPVVEAFDRAQALSVHSRRGGVLGIFDSWF